jgi:formylglycine-generating enzyme required for sulfatase activity
VKKVCISKPFWIGVTEVTNQQYGSVGKCSPASSQPDQPRGCMTWYDAGAFCKKHQARLPTNAEWEYAARGPDSLLFPYGNDFVKDNLLWDVNANPPDGGPLGAAGSVPANASWVGALDMVGGVFEWAGDSGFYKYVAGRFVDPVGTALPGGELLLRGGPYAGGTSQISTAAFSFLGNPSVANEYTQDLHGVRCASSN